MGGRAIPQGYDSKSDWALGITSQMRANEKSNSPGFPGNSVSSAYQASMNNLLNSERTSRTHFSGTNIGANIAAKNAEKNAEKARIKLLDEAHYSLSGDAARERQGLSWYQPLDMSTVGGMTRHGKGGLNEFGSNYADQEFMSYNYNQNWTGKEINVNLQTKVGAELSNAAAGIPGNETLTRWDVINNTGLEAEKAMGRLESSLNYPYMYNGVTIENDIDRELEQVDPENLWLDTTKSNIVSEIAIDTALDQGDANYYENLNFFEKVDYHAEAGYDLFKKKVVIPVGDAVVGAFNDLAYNNTETTADDSLLGKGVDLVSGHLEESYRAAAYHANEIKDEIVEIGGELKDHVYLYGHAIESIKHGLVEGEFLPPSHFEDVRKAEEHQKRLELEKAEKHRENVIQAHKQYGESRQQQLDDEEAKGYSDAQERARQYVAEGSAEAYYAKKHQERVIEAHKVYGESRELQRKLAAERKAKEQSAAHDKYQNDRIADIANKSDAAAAAERQRRRHEEAGKQWKDEEGKLPDYAEDFIVQKPGVVTTDDQKGPWTMKNQMYENQQNFNANSKNQVPLTTPEFELVHKKPDYLEKIGRDGVSLSGTDPFRFSTFAYPLDVTTDMTNGHYMLFYVNVQNKTKYSYAGYNDEGFIHLVGDEYETSETQLIGPPGSGKTAADYKTHYYRNKGASEKYDTEIAYRKNVHASGVPGNHLFGNQVTLMKQRKATQGLSSQLNLTTRITDSVAIYLPANVEDSTNAGYQDFKTGMAGFLALSGGDVLNKIKNHDFEGAASEFIGMGGTILWEMLKKAGVGAVSAFTGADGVQESFDKAFGQTLNPFIEVAFNNMGVREFDYTFNFRPKSAEETQEVKDIINLFRFHMVPELKGTNHRYMTLPSTFDIHYMYQTSPETSAENSFYSKIATCVLKSCNVNYTPDGVKSFESGAPTQISMRLSFMETEMLTKEKVAQGF